MHAHQHRSYSCSGPICDWISENLPFGHIDWSDIIIHVKEAFGVEFHSKKA